MKNFIMLTTKNEGTKFCIPVSNIKLVDSASDGARVYFINEPVEWRYVKESVEEVTEKIEKATEEKAEFIQFVFTKFGSKICVKSSEIRWIKEQNKNWHIVCIEGIGEIEVYGDLSKIYEAINPATIYLT